MMSQLNIIRSNDAWIFHREEIDTIQDGNCNVYTLLDAYSGFCFGLITSVDLPIYAEVFELLQEANTQAGKWPEQVLIAKSDPYIEQLQEIAKELKIEVKDLPLKSLNRYTHAFSDSFKEFKIGEQPYKPLSLAQEQEVKAFVPDTYGPCPCASGKKYKFCCQPCFKEIVFAMCAAEEGHLEEALQFMKEAEAKVGRTPEILCRYSICWSYFDELKSREYLMEAAKQDPNHPRTNYILGIEAASRKQYSTAALYYRKAIEAYPKEDKFHLNEAYNNLGSVYLAMGRYQEAKEVWEKALVLLPSDKMVRANLIEFIYENSEVPNSVREMSSFIKKYLDKYEMSFGTQF